MSQWRSASVLFTGGTEQIRALVGSRIRLRGALLSVPLFDPNGKTNETTELPPGAIGFVANPNPELRAGSSLLLAFPSTPSGASGSLAALMRSGMFQVVIVNEPTFRFQFEIEVP